VRLDARGVPLFDRRTSRCGDSPMVFSDPQLAVVGARDADLDPASTVVGAVSFEDQGRSRFLLAFAPASSGLFSCCPAAGGP
jgi:hypothetical protein